MKVVCHGCGWSSDVADEKIPVEGAKVTCPKCKTQFRLEKVVEFSVDQKPSLVSENTKYCRACGEKVPIAAHVCAHCKSALEAVHDQVPTKPAMIFGHGKLNIIEKVIIAFFGFVVTVNVLFSIGISFSKGDASQFFMQIPMLTVFTVALLYRLWKIKN